MYGSNLTIGTIIPEPRIFSGPRIHDDLTLEKIESVRTRFKAMDQELLSSMDLWNVLEEHEIHLNEREFKNLVNRMIGTSGREIKWTDFLNHVILLFSSDDDKSQKESLSDPVIGNPKVFENLNRHPIRRIRYCPTVTLDRTTNYSKGQYITVSEEGSIVWWSSHMEYLKSNKASNPRFKASNTLILDCVFLPDVRIICISTSELELRFFDFTASNFFQRLVISCIPNAVNAMYYWYPKSTDITSKLILGDILGNIILIEFSSLRRGPFQCKSEDALIHSTWRDLIKNKKIPEITVTEFPNGHPEEVLQVYYSPIYNAIFSASKCEKTRAGKQGGRALIINELGVHRQQKVIYLSQGIICFDIDENNNIMATGGPDCNLRLWNPLIPNEPIGLLPGHVVKIIFLFLQDKGTKCYSFDVDKNLKVWDVSEQCLLQSYIGFTSLPDKSRLCFSYNYETRDFIIAGRSIAKVVCALPINLIFSDGETHTDTITAILYNPIFKSVVTCGLDSIIIIWDPWLCRRHAILKRAHIQIIDGTVIPISITSACFSQNYQFLLTGGTDGSIKMWSFNDKTCLKYYYTANELEITDLFWVNDRMLAMGWNKTVMEFHENPASDFVNGKLWESCHKCEILSSSISDPTAVATSSQLGELIIWRLETGQPYMKFNVKDPNRKLKLSASPDIASSYDTNDLFQIVNANMSESTNRLVTPPVSRTSIRTSLRRASSSERMDRHKILSDSSNSILHSPRGSKLKHNESKKSIYSDQLPRSSLFRRASSRKSFDFVKRSQLRCQLYRRALSQIDLPPEISTMKTLSVSSILFLQKRPMDSQYGTLLVSIDTGFIQVYSHHISGGYLTSFLAIHIRGDNVARMTTDSSNEYLFIGTAMGYIKTYHLINFCVPKDVQRHVCMPALRNEFHFLIRSRFLGRAERTALTSQKGPLLVNSYRGHLKAITIITYVEEAKIILTGSTDCSVRLWTLSGRYIGTFGSPISWPEFSPLECPGKNYKYRIPPDVYKHASSTTLRVLSGSPPREKKLKNMHNKSVDGMGTFAFKNTGNCVPNLDIPTSLLAHLEVPRQNVQLKHIQCKSSHFRPVFSLLKLYDCVIPNTNLEDSEAFKRLSQNDFT